MAFVWELTEETIHLPLGCLQGGLPWIVENRAHLRASSSTFPSAIASFSLRVKSPSASFSAVESDAICGTDCEMGETAVSLEDSGTLDPLEFKAMGRGGGIHQLGDGMGVGHAPAG